MMTQQSQNPALEATRKFLVLYRYLRRYGHDTHHEGVRGRDMSTLRYIHEEGPLTIGQISEYLFINTSSASELVTRMEEAGYLVRRRSHEDCRVVYVELTPKGQQLAEATPTGGIPLLRERIKTLNEEQLNQIDEAFTTLIQVMEIDPNAFQ
jgi:DNA-binding MarR family transcriptional regulator